MKDLDLFFLPEYAKLYDPMDGKSEVFTFESAHGRIQNLFLCREIEWKVSGQTYYDITTPYGYGGPIILECDDSDILMAEYAQAFSCYCRERNIVCEFVRFHLFDNVSVRERYYGEICAVQDNVIVDTTGSYDDIRTRYDYKVRKNVKKAMASGLEVVSENNSTHLSDFLSIYYATMDRNNAQRYYYFPQDFFENIVRTIPGHYMFFYVIKDGEVISTELVLCSTKYAYSFLGGTNEAFYALRPNDFLKDAIIRWCGETGREKFILGGGYHKDDGISRYKHSFTQTPDVPFFIGHAIYNQTVYDQLVERRAAVDAAFDRQSSFFPLYRA